MSQPVVLDIETKHTFQEVGFDHEKLQVSVAGLYDYENDEYRAYLESELPLFFNKLEHASFVIGFNSNKFDLPVLSPYYIGKVDQFPSLDILEEVEKYLGYRVALDDLARATLNIKKSGHGFLAIEYFRKGEIDKLKEYCLDDVRITKELYEYGKKHGKLYIQTHRGDREISVNFEKRDSSKNHVSLSLPF